MRSTLGVLRLDFFGPSPPAFHLIRPALSSPCSTVVRVDRPALLSTKLVEARTAQQKTTERRAVSPCVCAVRFCLYSRRGTY